MKENAIWMQPSTEGIEFCSVEPAKRTFDQNVISGLDTLRFLVPVEKRSCLEDTYMVRRSEMKAGEEYEEKL